MGTAAISLSPKVWMHLWGDSGGERAQTFMAFLDTGTQVIIVSCPLKSEPAEFSSLS